MFIICPIIIYQLQPVPDFFCCSAFTINNLGQQIPVITLVVEDPERPKNYSSTYQSNSLNTNRDYCVHILGQTFNIIDGRNQPIDGTSTNISIEGIISFFLSQRNKQGINFANFALLHMTTNRYHQIYTYINKSYICILHVCTYQCY